jgi:hypothetical protein
MSTRSTQSSPLVTVAIPTWNRASLLRDCLASITRQTFSDYEVIVSDNASTDNTAEVVASFRDPRVHYAPLERNIGLHGNLSRCLQLGRAPYVAVVADDERMLPENLERKVALLEEHPSVGIVHSAIRLAYVATDGAVTEKVAVHTKAPVAPVEPGLLLVRRLMTEPSWMYLSSLVLRRSTIGDERFEEIDGPPCDLGICLRIAWRTDVAYVPEAQVVSQVHAEADSIKEGTHELGSDGHVTTFRALARNREVKERFLARFGHELPDAEELRAASRRKDRRGAMYLLQSQKHLDRTPFDTWKAFRGAVGVDSRLLVAPKVLRFLVSGLAGRRVRMLVRRARSRRTTSSPSRGRP